MIVKLGTHTITYPRIELSAGIMVVTGASGTGKTTLLRLLHGELKAEEFEQNVLKTALMPQTPTWIPYLKMSEQLKVARAKDVDFSSLGLDQLLHRYPHQLSIGQLQRFSLLAALHANTDVLLLDEPTSALDDDWAEAAMTLISAWVASKPKGSVVVVTHDERLKNTFATAKQLHL